VAAPEPEEEGEEAAECVLVLLGLPASGKSRLVAEVAQRAAGQGTQVLTVSYDQLVPLARQAEMVGEEGAWRKEREAIVAAVEAVLEGSDGPLEGCRHLEQLREQGVRPGGRLLVLVDDNNYLASMRQAYHRLARRRGAGYCQLHLQAATQLAHRLNTARPAEARVPPEVVDSMAARLEPPRPLVRPWEQLSLVLPVVEGAKLELGMVEALVRAARRHPAPPPPDTQVEAGAGYSGWSGGGGEAGGGPGRLQRQQAAQGRRPGGWDNTLFRVT
jgi:tRNA uridine 5-carbamoylmethylation protein Kti12